MAGYFFDSSALVKLYHAELGTPLVDQIIHTSGNSVRISRFSTIELTSAFAIKARTQAITRDDARVFVRQFREDIVNDLLQVFTIGEADFTVADTLIERHAFALRLRALDALQLSVALGLRSQGLVDHLVAADKTLCEVAGMEGFSVINLEQI